MDDERDYLRRCERRERRMARLARCDRARQAHERLAGIYAARRRAAERAGVACTGPSRLELARRWWRRLFPAERSVAERAPGPFVFDREPLHSR